jgi:hypothetical protein
VPKHNPRRRALLPHEERVHLEAQEAAREWRALIHFDDTDDADDEPPFAQANSLMDTPYQGHLVLEFTEQWSGGVRLSISDGEHEHKFMLHTRQIETLIEALNVWNRGFTRDWLTERRGTAD